MGNEIDGEGISGDTSDVVLCGNDVNGEICWDTSMPDHTLPASYYLGAKPLSYGSAERPSTGGDMPEAAIPALERWTAKAYVPQP